MQSLASSASLSSSPRCLRRAPLTRRRQAPRTAPLAAYSTPETEGVESVAEAATDDSEAAPSTPEAEKTPLTSISAGDTASGFVRSIKPYGCFVDVGAECDGLVHISEMSHKFVRDVHSIVRVGQRVDVRVLSTDPPARRLSLSMKGEAYRATPGEKVTGKVVNVTDFGAFVNLSPGTDGLVHRSEVTSDPYADWESFVEVGKEVEVTVLEVDGKAGRISLSMRDDCDEYWEDVEGEGDTETTSAAASDDAATEDTAEEETVAATEEVVEDAVEDTVAEAETEAPAEGTTEA